MTGRFDRQLLQSDRDSSELRRRSGRNGRRRVPTCSFTRWWRRRGLWREEGFGAVPMRTLGRTLTMNEGIVDGVLAHWRDAVLSPPQAAKIAPGPEVGASRPPFGAGRARSGADAPGRAVSPRASAYRALKQLDGVSGTKSANCASGGQPE